MHPTNRVTTASYDGTWGDLPAVALPAVAAVLAADHTEALSAVKAFSEAGDGELLLVARSRADASLRDRLLKDGFTLVEGGEITQAPDASRAPTPGRVWLLTSGTTGRPSRVAHTLESLTTVTGQQPRRVWLCPYTPGAYAWWQVVTLALAHADQGIVTVEHGDLATWPTIARDAGVTAASGTPTFWRQGLMREHEALAAAPIVQATLGGEPVDQSVLDAVSAALPDARVSWIYASSEAGASIAVHDGQAGFPVAWLERPQGPWVVDGELHLASPHSGVDMGDRIATGDAAEIRGGRVHIVGRLDSDEINVGGAKVSAASVREVLLAHPAVEWAAVRGRKAPLVGLVVAADVVLSAESGDIDDATLLRWCRERLPEHGVPRRLRRLDGIPIKESLKSDV